MVKVEYLADSHTVAVNIHFIIPYLITYFIVVYLCMCVVMYYYMLCLLTIGVLGDEDDEDRVIMGFWGLEDLITL